MDVSSWLEALGLGQYDDMFAENGVDADVLPLLTADDLKEMGVAAIGHRRKLIQAIEALGVAELDVGPASSPPAERPLVLVAPVADLAERRQLTVMFVDLVGSTALSQALDPEEMSDVLRRFQSCCTAAAAEVDGYVAKLMGDGVLLYFGWPQAFEDAAERAVRAGLAILDGVAALPRAGDRNIQARIGVATGLVVVGELIGSGAAQERSVVGETPNLAARFQAVAEPHSMIIGGLTRDLVHDLFELDDLGEQHLKGIDAPKHAWRVRGPLASGSRFEARHAGGLNRLVGREQEVALLIDRWQQAREGEGQVVLLSGEPGIGKSRILHALREHVAEQSRFTLSHFCSAFHQTTALHPVIGRLERVAGFARTDGPASKLERLEGILSSASGDVARAAAPLAELLSIPAGDRYPPLGLPAAALKQRIFEVLVEQIEGLSRKQPILVLFEDIHWADPTTVELLGYIIERVSSLPVLLLLTFRPEFVPPWHQPDHLTSLTLNRLTRKRSIAIIGGVTGGRALPDAVLEEILLRTDGVPLFVEELTKTVLESGLLQQAGDAFELAGPLPPLAIPTTLHDSLIARLDRLAPVKEVAQAAAAIGREFTVELLAAVMPLDNEALQQALLALVAAELIFVRGTPTQPSYMFKHALVRDTAYQSLLKSRRQQLHMRIAQALERRFPETLETAPELVAHHLSEAGLVIEATAAWLRAGRHALARSAAVEAVSQLERGLALAKPLDDEAARSRELELQLALGQALIPTRGFAADETRAAYERARSLCEQLGDEAHLVPVLYGHYVCHFERAELRQAYTVANQLLDLGRARDDVPAQIVAHRSLGSVSFSNGDLDAARRHCEAGLALYDPKRDHRSGLTYAIDSKIVCVSWIAHAAFAMGEIETSRARTTEMIAWAREVDHVPTLALAFQRACSIHRMAGDAGAVRDLA